MREAIFSRCWVVGWLALFLAPVAMMEICRESSPADDTEHHYVAPTPEFVAAMHGLQVASADR